LTNNVDYIIVGQGLAGTWLAYWLLKENKSFIIFDKSEKPSASVVSSGIINPVTGRRPVKSWMIDELTAFAVESYLEAEAFTGKSFFFKRDIVRLFPNSEIKNYYETKKAEGVLPDEIILKNDTSCNYALNSLSEVFDTTFGGCCIRPSYWLNSKLFIESFREIFQQRNSLIEEQFDYDLLKSENNSVSYKNFQAKQVVFCEGYKLLDNPFHKNLPLAANKGEFLLVRIQGLAQSKMIHAGIFIVPVGNDLFWAGSDYQLDFYNDEPSETGRQNLEQQLKDVLKTSYTVVHHGTGIRPTVKNERRPFAGIYPPQSNIGLLNGLGTKGTSLAPYFAHQLVNYLVYRKAIDSEADVKRFY
jgi:glycine/D-amino acid oxidase-like deaminating enzyme